jgi:hypothetical protein
MNKVKKLYKAILETQGADFLIDKEIWCSLDIYSTLKQKTYKGLSIYTSKLMPNDTVVIGKLFW